MAPQTPHATVTAAAPGPPPGESSLRARSAKGVLWTAIQIWSARSMSALTFVVLGRNLAPTDFGLVALSAGVIAVLTLISDSGLATYLVRQRTLSPTSTHTAFWTSLGIATCLALLTAGFADPLARLFDAPGLTPVLRWLTVPLVLAGASSVPAALLRREFAFRSLAVRGTAATLVGSVTAVVLALAGAGVWALVAQALTTAVVSTVMLFAAVPWRPRAAFDVPEAREMLSFGVRLLGIDLLMQARDRGEEFTLAATSTTTVLGFWSVSTRFIKLIQDTGSQVVSTVATPAFSRLQDDTERLFRWYGMTMAATGAVVFPSMIFVAATAPDLVPFVMGDQWAATGKVAQITALTATVGVFSYFDRSLCVAVNKLRAEMILVLAIVATHLVVVVLAAPHGLVTLALALLARQVATFPLRQVVLHRVVGAPYRCLVRPMRVLLAAAAMGAVVLVGTALLPIETRDGRLLFAVAAAAVSYPVLLAATSWSVMRELVGDLDLLEKVRRRRSSRS